MANKKSFLEKQIEAIEDRLYKLDGIKIMFVAFFLMYTVFVVFYFSLEIISGLLSHKVNRFFGIADLIIFPAALIPGIVSIRHLNSLIRENRAELKIKKKERDAEVQVQEFLKKSLTEEYHVFSNIFTGYGDVDAVVVGPTGAYAIEAKSNSGTVAQNSKSRLIVIDGEKPHKDYRRQAIANSNMIKKILDNVTGLKTFVSPILVFPFASIMKDAILESPKDNYKVPVLGVKELVEYIYSNKQDALSKDLIEKYSEVLKDMHISEDE